MLSLEARLFLKKQSVVIIIRVYDNLVIYIFHENLLFTFTTLFLYPLAASLYEVLICKTSAQKSFIQLVRLESISKHDSAVYT
jgi:hypothetical protein